MKARESKRRRCLFRRGGGRYSGPWRHLETKKVQEEAEPEAMQVRASRMDCLADVLGAGAFACLLACFVALLGAIILLQCFRCFVVIFDQDVSVVAGLRVFN